MHVKRNLERRNATQEEIDGLQYPKDRFDLVSVDYTDCWTYPVTSNGKVYHIKAKSVHVTLKCKRCGTVKQVADKKTVSCKQGPCHVKWVDWTDKRVGHLVPKRYVLTAYKKGQTPKWYWECVCDCGNTTLASAHSLYYGAKNYCEACARKLSIEKTKLPNNLAAWHRVYKDTRTNATKRGYSFGLSFEDFHKLATSNCYFCGDAPSTGSYGVERNGVDRLDNTKGYVAGNCVPCCGMCNVMKMAHTEEEFYDKIVKIYNHRCLKSNDYPLVADTVGSVQDPNGSTRKRVEMAVTQNG